MNNRIQNFAEQARIAMSTVEGLSIKDWIDAYNQKFALLIIQECVGVVEGGSFLHDQAPTAIFARECSGAIKQHFGVEE
jgi:hypothetical protein